MQSKQVHVQEIKRVLTVTGKGDWEERALSDAQNGMRRQSRLIGTWTHGQMSGEHTWSLVMHFGYCFDLFSPCYPNSASTEIVDRF
jgi:hypothetical protein